MIVQVTKRVLNYRVPFFRYLASGCGVHDLDFSYWIGISIASKIVREVCLSTWFITRPECIPKLTKEQWELTALEYERRANFPHCLGAVEGKHTRVIKPNTVARCSVITKNFSPVVLMAVQTLITALCTFTLVVREKIVILPFLNDLFYGHQLRHLCWNYPVRYLFQEKKVQMYHTSL